MEIINSILLFIITGILGSFGFWLRNFVKKFLNEKDIMQWKIASIDYGCTEAIGEPYEIARNKKWEDKIEEDKLKTKNR